MTIPNPYAALDLLGCATLLVARDARIVFANNAFESLFNVSRRNVVDLPITHVFTSDALMPLFEAACRRAFDQRRQDIVLSIAHREAVQVHVTVNALEEPALAALFEFRESEPQSRYERDDRYAEQGRVNRELIRNLAHEIKNPLGGIRGAAQLLEHELVHSDVAVDLREYTQVIVKEADRLQTLVDRLLAPHRKPQVTQVNIHEVCERVRSVILAEHPVGLEVVRDYDVSVPEFTGDKEQLIQAVLNIAQNAAQALKSRVDIDDRSAITLRTRITRNVTIERRRHRLALDLHIADNGPGIPESIRDRIFLPLVSGREGGSGLGLTLAQTFVHQHQGIIECDSRPGHTEFRLLIPLP